VSLCSPSSPARLTRSGVDACDQSFPFGVLQDLLETQTIPSCSHVFAWIEARARALTADMVPQKGKALVILRTLNDLLRRLSKMGANTIFCGRILTFLSAVFPLGERSGVNLRGEYGPMWETVERPAKEEKKVEEDKGKEKMEGVDGAETKEGGEDAEKKEDVMQVDPEPAKEDKEKDGACHTLLPSASPSQPTEFYDTFWSLQLPFSRPPVFAGQKMFKEFRAAVERVLPVLKEATAKERAMSGSRGTHASASAPAPSAALKRKRVPEGADGPSDYFFAKFLTSPELLELEVRAHLLPLSAPPPPPPS
jgi:hypothetical protein